ncbi:MAG TPA: cupin, partial [Gammaproteobacteria bacterium]
YLLLPAHCRHRVAWTAAGGETVWLAIHLAAGLQ